MKRAIWLLIILFCPGVHAALQEKTVDYQAGSTHLKGFLVWDDAKRAKRPGVLVVHEWWGLNDYARNRAVMLAKLGYAALAVDMYGDGKSTEHPEEASAFMKSVTEHAGVAKQRFMAAMEFLQKQSFVDPDKIAAIGYCFGGSTVLNMARQGVPLATVASFHGNLVTDTPANKGAVKAKVLVFNGAEDSFITKDSIAAFEKEMKSASADYLFFNYPDAKHSFTNPDADRLSKAHNLPLAYNADADKQSWATMREAFKETLGK